MSRSTDIVRKLAQPVVESLGLELWDVEYVKEAGSWYLRLYIDKEGGISITDCEAVSRAMDPILDEEDPIEESYTFEVSSPGVERELKTGTHFERFMGSLVSVKLYAPVDGKKEFEGKLTGYKDGAVSIECDGDVKEFVKGAAARVRLVMEQ